VPGQTLTEINGINDYGQITGYYRNSPGNDTSPGNHGFLATPTSEWTTNGLGDWNIASNWSFGVPNGPCQIANFFTAITANHTIVDDATAPITVGTLHFNNPNEYVISGAGSLILEGNDATPGLIQVDQGIAKIDLPLTIARVAGATSNVTFDVATGANLLIANPLTISPNIAVTQTGGGAVTYQSSLTLQPGASLNFTGSTIAASLTLQAGSSAAIAPSTGAPSVMQLNSLTLAPGSTFDITNNHLIINYGSGPDPVATVRGYLKSAYNGGIWTNPGLTSRTVAAQVANAISHGGGVYSIGYADGSDVNQLPVVATGNQIVIEPALAGDTNADWEHGDFNYDGSVNFLDIGLLAQNLNKNILNTPLSDVIPDPSGALAAQWNLAVAELQANQTEPANLPEPGAMALPVLAASAMLLRRRRHVRI
jgi:hypothetical protein